jgi:asparagine synthase (glutamine-hydrolysing)
MPGIAGIISRNVSNQRTTIEKMVASMMHEPFYRSGIHCEPKLGIAIGWTALTGTFADCMPVLNERKDVVLAFAGEDFADPSAIESLRSRGHEFQPDDASYLPHLYEERGWEFFKGLNGCSSGVLLDLRESKVVLFNDRFGLNRIYIHENEDAFYFASEAKALLKVLPHLRELNQQSLGEFFACGSALQNRSLFSGISLLPSASAWTFRKGRPTEKESYFSSSSWEHQPELSTADYYEKLKQTFTCILPRYFRGTQQIALSLTGGLDSRMIIACATPKPGELPCYTFGGMYRDCADVRIARKIAAASQQPFNVIPVTPEFFATFPTLAERSVYLSDGAMDVTGSVELFANRAARQIAPVRMTGNYGSEILRGNVVFKVGNSDRSMFDPAFISQLSLAAVTFAEERGQPRTTFIVSKQVPWYHYARLAVEQSQLTVRSPFLDNELVAVAYQAPTELTVNKDLAHRFIADCDPKLGKISTDRGYVWQPGRSTSRLGIFCQEFMPRVEYVFDYGMPPWMAKLDRFTGPLRFERLFLGRQKFYHFRTWYRDALSNHVREMLLDARTLNRPYLNRKRVERIVTAHVTGRENHTLEIHKLLTSELIQRRFIEQN